MALWKSSWLETEVPRVRASPASLSCFLEQNNRRRKLFNIVGGGGGGGGVHNVIFSFA